VIPDRPCPRAPARGLSAPARPFAPAMRALLALAALAALTACGPSGNPGPRTEAPGPVTPVAPPAGDTIGTGPVKVGLILPLTQASGPSVVGTSLRNAAELAISETGQNDITLLVKDDRSSPAGAAAAAQAAIQEGADLIIGPLFAGNTKEVGRVARAAGKPVIAFSTDTSAAARGVYLLSFLVESYVDRIVGFASQKGKRAIAALVPESDYGNLALGEFQSAAARYGMNVQGIERYSGGTLAGAIERIGGLGDRIDSLFIPEQAEQMSAVSQQLVAKGIDPKKIQILGTGIWNDARVLRLPALQGAWFSAPENAGFNAFAQRYRAKFNSDPTRISTLAYDSVSLAVALSRSQGGQRFSEQVLLNPSGFNGADGVFRFKADGQNDRGLSVLQINNGTTTVLSPAPRSFVGSPNGT
jgi:branched-chain amino acid transport system substrate-binding protein